MERERALNENTSSEGDIIKPFVMRAHRLSLMLDICKGMPVREKVEQIIKFTTLGDIYRAVDILGGTEEQLENFRKSTTDFLMGFSQLSSDHPIMIVVDQKDKGCEGCAHGEHCRRQKEIDEVYIKGFKTIGKKLGVAETITVIKDVAYDSDLMLGNVSSILTTAQTARIVIMSDEFKKFMYAN